MDDDLLLQSIFKNETNMKQLVVKLYYSQAQSRSQLLATKATSLCLIQYDFLRSASIILSENQNRNPYLAASTP